ncbi:MAG: P-loop NTPase [Methanomicrobiales archaeon]|jgi:nitrogenase iron protein NifH|nr:P-loop NTPase [Methanomicrobiales archaeon]
MKKIAIYGKGGIGKSTTTSNLAAALAKQGLVVMQIGCDPKADSTIMLMHGRPVHTILHLMSEKNRNQESAAPDLDKMVHQGYGGVLCAECGGPSPGVGCAGRGIITAFEALSASHAYDIYRPDFVLYDVLGDVVCGGFAMPLRKGYAEEVYIVTSGEKMALYAARNIALAIKEVGSTNSAVLSGIIQNSRGIENEDTIIDELAAEIETTVIARVPRDPVVQRCEAKNKTVIEGEPDSAYAQVIEQLAREIISMK